MLHDIALYKFNIHIHIHRDKSPAENNTAFALRCRGPAVHGKLLSANPEVREL